MVGGYIFKLFGGLNFRLLSGRDLIYILLIQEVLRES